MPSKEEFDLMSLPVAQGGHACFAKEFQQRGVECGGGYDVRKTYTDGSHDFPPCPLRAECGNRQSNKVLPQVTITSQGAPMTVQQPVSQQVFPVRTPVTQPTAEPSRSQPSQSGLRINLPANLQPAQPAPQPMVGIAQQYTNQQQIVRQQPSYQEAVAVRQQVQSVQYGQGVAHPPQQMMVHAVPASMPTQTFLSKPEPIQEGNFIKGIGVSAARGAAKGLFMTLAEIFDTVTFTGKS